MKINSFWYHVENDTMILTVFTQILTTASVVAGGVGACKTTCMVSVIQCECHPALTLEGVCT